MEKDPELEQVLCDALSLEQDYPYLYCPPAHSTFPTRQEDILPEEMKEVPSTSSRKCRRRTLYSKEQTLFLEEKYLCNPYPSYSDRCCFAQAIGIPEPRIQVWFQNKRARHQKKSSKKQEDQ